MRIAAGLCPFMVYVSAGCWDGLDRLLILIVLQLGTLLSVLEDSHTHLKDKPSRTDEQGRIHS